MSAANRKYSPDSLMYRVRPLSINGDKAILSLLTQAEKGMRVIYYLLWPSIREETG